MCWWIGTTPIAPTQLKLNHRMLILTRSFHPVTIFRIVGFLDLEKPHLLQVFYSSQLKSSKAFFHTLPLRLCPCQFGQKRDCYLLVNYHFSFSRLSPASLSVTVALHPIKRNSDDDAEWKQTGRSCASTLAGCTGGHDPALKGYDLSLWTSVMTVSLRPRQAETSDKKPFDPNTAGPDLHLLIPSILTDIHHHCHHCQQSRNGRCVCVCASGCERDWQALWVLTDLLCANICLQWGT